MVLFRITNVFAAAAAAAAAFSSVALLLLAPAAQACRCDFRSLCENIGFASVVLRGHVVRRTALVDRPDFVTYNVKVGTLYKTEVGVDYPVEIEVTTSASAADCGVYLQVGGEYLLDLYRYKSELRSVGACGATQSWTTLPADRIATLGDINSACDPCAACGESQDCLLYTTSSSVTGGREEFYCADTCAAGVCGAEETCYLNEADCTEGPCPPVAECGTPPASPIDKCGGSCLDSEECLPYTAGVDQYYCSAVCDPSPCGDGEECSVLPVYCPADSICRSGFACTRAGVVKKTFRAAIGEGGLCEGRCSKFQECLFYSGNFAEDQYYCSAVCDPSPCGEDEECTLGPASCAPGSICGKRSICSPLPAAATEVVATIKQEDPCDGRCGDFEECLFYTGDLAEDQHYCSAVCDPSPCEEGEQCHLIPESCAAGSICGNGFICAPAANATLQEEDPCAPCGEFQDCRVYTNGAFAEYYCADVCNPSPCEGSKDKCSLVEQGDDCDAETSACPPLATCASATVAVEEEERANPAEQTTKANSRLGSSSAN
ncbi:unnamed protein product [Ectocarpus sp. 12 AP-2014]